MNVRQTKPEADNVGDALPDIAEQASLEAPTDTSLPKTQYDCPVNFHRLLLGIVFVAAFAELSFAVVNTSAMPVYIKSLKIPDYAYWVSAAGVAFILVEGLLKSPFGLLGDRVGRKVMICVGPTISIVTALLTPFVHRPIPLVLLRVIDGIGAAALWPAAFSFIGDHVPEERRAQAMSMFNLAYMLGIALGPVIGGKVDVYFHSVTASFFLAAVLFSITSVLAFFVLPNIKPLAHGKAGSGEGGFDPVAFKRMLAAMPMTLLMIFTVFLGVGFVMLFVKLFVMDRFQIKEDQFGYLLLGPALVVALVSVPLGGLGDKIGKALAVKIGIGICAVSMWALMFHFTQLTLIIGGSIIGVGFVIAFPAWMAMITADCDPRQRGAVVGAVGTAQGIGAITGASCSGFLYQHAPIAFAGINIPKHGLPFVGCAIMLSLSWVLAIATIREHRLN